MGKSDIILPYNPAKINGFLAVCVETPPAVSPYHFLCAPAVTISGRKAPFLLTAS